MRVQLNENKEHKAGSFIFVLVSLAANGRELGLCCVCF